MPFDAASYIAGKNAGGGGGGDITVEALSVTENGTITAPSGKAYSPVVVDVPNSYAAADEGKVVSNGELVAQTAHAEVTQNGTIDTTLNNSVTVNVSGARIPSAYQEVEYIDTNGTDAYIITDYTPVRYDNIYASFSLNAAPSQGSTESQAFFQAGMGDYSYVLLYSKPGNYTSFYYKYFATGGATEKKYSVVLNRFHILQTSDGFATFGGGSIGSNYGDALDGNDTEICIGNNKSGTRAPLNAKIGQFMIRNSATIKLNLIPCVRKSDNVVGMYDAVSETFYTNAGSGAFVAGDPVIPDEDVLNVLLGGS